MPKVSVVIPFLNAAKYIERCATSLFSQTLADLEFIFVDDNSGDKSGNLLNAVLLKFPDRIPETTILRNDTNMGSSLSRKRGLSVAKGDYLFFCDADDSIEPYMLETMYSEALRGGFDMVICNYDRVFPDGSHVPSPSQKPSDDLLKDLLTNRLDNYLWNKLIKRDIFNYPHFFPTASVWEDVGLISQLAVYCKKISWTDAILYHYYINPGSLMNTGVKRKRCLDKIQNVSLVEDFLKENNLLGDYSKYLTRHKGYILSECFDSPRKDYLKVFPEIHFRLFFSPYIPFRNKIGHLTKLLGIHGISRAFRKF